MSLPDFNRLFEQSRQLTAHIVPPETMPQLERGLDQIDAQTKKLSNKASRAGDPALYASVAGGAGGVASGLQASTSQAPTAKGQIDARTAYLLANRGFDAEKVTATLNQINPAATFEPVEGLYDTDIEGYLRLEHETIITTAIEENRSQTMKDCNDRFERTLHRDWEKAKKRIFEELGQHKQQSAGGRGSGFKSPQRGFGRSTTGAALGPGGLVTGHLSTASTAAPSSNVSLQMLARNKNYAQVVEALNKARLEKKHIELLSAFQNIAQRLDRGDVAHHQLIKCWRLLQLLLGEQNKPAGSGNAFGRSFGSDSKERMFADAYRAQEESAGLSEEAVQFRKMLIEGGKQFLHENHWEYVQQVVTQHRVQVGGFPTPHVIIDAYIDIKFQKHGVWQPQHSLDIYDGKAAWAHIYYLLRCGLRNEAYQYAAEFSGRLESTPDARFFMYFQEYLEEGRLSANLRNQLLDEWNSRIRQTLIPDPTTGRLIGDPFKAALYKIIGRCEMSSKIIKSPDVAPSIEDYLWLQLNLIQEDLRNDDFLQDRYTLRDMARNMLRFGANHFSPQGKTPHVYFLVLLLCGEFERAVAHILNHDHLFVDAIHFAIALSYYGVLRVPDNPYIGDGGEMLSVRNADSAVPGSSVYELAYFHFARMVYHYAHMFFKTDPVDAMHYLSLIALYGGELSGGDSVGAAGAGKSTVQKEYTRVTHTHLRELLLESGIPVKLVGEFNLDGLRTPGELEKYGPLSYLRSFADVVSRIIKPAAEEADRRGKFMESIQLYNYAQEYDTVVGILCKQLGEVVASHRPPVDLGDPLYPSSGLFGTGKSSSTSAASAASAAAGEAVATRAMEVLDLYRSQPGVSGKISESKRQTCALLIRLYQFMKDVDGGRAEVALESLRASGIVPLDPDMGSITRHAENFRSLDESVARSLPQVLVMAMTTLAGLHRSLKEGRVMDLARQARMGELRAQARAIILFAGSIQYRIPSDTFAKLNRLDVMMG
ncbi:hypothetical protein HDV05_002249 [Chytridiales sp. JEL 0842]|nr:hypothetical protein HDV05_002249 [Chytridiales sp. JEL 0842]